MGHIAWSVVLEVAHGTESQGRQDISKVLSVPSFRCRLRCRLTSKHQHAWITLGQGRAGRGGAG